MSALTNSNSGVTSDQGIKGFSQKVLRYFLTFIQTDFKKQQAPRRRVLLKTDSNFKIGVPLRKYASLYKAVWQFAKESPGKGLEFRIGVNQYTSPISVNLRNLIKQHIDAIDAELADRIAKSTVEYANSKKSKGLSDPEKFIEDVQIHLVEEIGQRIVQPLLAMLENPFREAAYSFVESVYELEAELTDNLAQRPLENLPFVLNTLLVKGDITGLKTVFAEMFGIEDIREQAISFFENFATADFFHEMRDLQQSLRSVENQSLYLYFCELRFGTNTFPLFYIPATLEYDDKKREFVITFDPHLLVNKQAVDWVMQEHQGESAKLPVSPIHDRVVYLNTDQSFLDEIEKVFNRLVPALDVASNIDIKKMVLQQASSTTIKISNTAYFAVFDRSDESMVNDYEELLSALSGEQDKASILFENIIRGFIHEDPESVANAVNQEWDSLSVPERLVADSPIPINEEQRKITTALKNPKCNYISVQGPPGTGKSHTISALAFDGIMNNQRVLVLSDKTEALDVVQDKLEKVLSKVRGGDGDFPNPILRLGKSGNTYNRLISGSAKTKIKQHHQAASRHEQTIKAEAQGKLTNLKADIEKTISLLSDIKLEELDSFHLLETRIESLRPGLITKLQHPAAPEKIKNLEGINQLLRPSSLSTIFDQLDIGEDFPEFSQMIPMLRAWKRAATFKIENPNIPTFELFTQLEAEHHKPLQSFINEYKDLKMPIFGYLFKGSQIRALNTRVGNELPCSDPIDLHLRQDMLVQASRYLGTISHGLKSDRLEHLTGFVWQLFRNDAVHMPNVDLLADLFSGFQQNFIGHDDQSVKLLDIDGFTTAEDQVKFIMDCVQYAISWAGIRHNMNAVPKIDYVGSKTRIEELSTARMATEIDRRFLNFVDNKSATAKSIGGVIKNKMKFPEEEFSHLSDAFPVIIAGIREYAEYVPLKEEIFDLVIIDEASQVSVAQALPAVLRGKKVVVFGDAKQFSNVKSSQASNVTNAGHLSDIEAYFRANVSNASTKIERLKHFDVKKSILEFFGLISNFETMLVKHFRGYQELISFSSAKFYDHQLQAIKIRTAPVDEVIRFEILDHGLQENKKNTNQMEADFILKELRRMIDDEEDMTVGVLTPFREQVKVLNEVLFRDSYAHHFESRLRLKIMTFDSCQGEERDLIIFSMVATKAKDMLNYIFPVSLESAKDQIEEQLKMQRLNVGFSRGKEAFLFVLSKPVSEFRGGIGLVLQHYKTILEERVVPDESDVDPASPMERKVLDWILKSPFYQSNEDILEVVPQFPIGEYLRQLDPTYTHPAYRCDFLIRYYGEEQVVNIIVEYDGFTEHFVEHQKIHNGNWEHYYRPEDIERQMVIESYGYKFLRINRFNIGDDPIKELSNRLIELVKDAISSEESSALISSIIDDAESIGDGSKKKCSRCGEIHEIDSFWDKTLKAGQGAYGRVCLICKASVSPKKSKRRSRSRYRWS